MASNPPAAIWRSPLAPVLRDFMGRVSRAVAPLPTGRLTSWYRSRATNMAAEGRDWSQHLVGLAVDLWTPNLAELAQRLRSQGLVVVSYSDHVHAQLWPKGRLEALARTEPAVRVLIV